LGEGKGEKNHKILKKNENPPKSKSLRALVFNFERLVNLGLFRVTPTKIGLNFEISRQRWIERDRSRPLPHCLCSCLLFLSPPYSKSTINPSTKQQYDIKSGLILRVPLHFHWFHCVLWHRELQFVGGVVALFACIQSPTGTPLAPCPFRLHYCESGASVVDPLKPEVLLFVVAVCEGPLVADGDRLVGGM
jgi:hypothetical protein